MVATNESINSLQVTQNLSSMYVDIKLQCENLYAATHLLFRNKIQQLI